jgi:hypothetical protein
LDDELGGAFRGTKIRAKKARVGVDHGDQGNGGKVMALRQHLRANHNARLAPLNLR